LINDDVFQISHFVSVQQFVKFILERIEFVPLECVVVQDFGINFVFLHFVELLPSNLIVVRSLFSLAAGLEST